MTLILYPCITQYDEIDKEESQIEQTQNTTNLHDTDKARSTDKVREEKRSPCFDQTSYNA
jgi:hypothetical protein